MSLKSLVALGCAVSAFAFAAADAATFTYNFTISDIYVYQEGDPDYRGSIAGSGKLFADYDDQAGSWTVTGANGTATTSDWGPYLIHDASGAFSGDGSVADPFAIDSIWLTGQNESGYDNSFGFFYVPGDPQMAGLLSESFGSARFSLTQDAPAAETSDVPEAASWAMMVAGFGVVGAALRRRRVSVSFG